MIERPSTDDRGPDFAAQAAAFVEAAGPTVEARLLLLLSVINALAEVFDDTCTGEVVQLVSEMGDEQLAEHRADHASFFALLTSIRSSADTLAGVMGRVVPAYRIDPSNDNPIKRRNDDYD